MIRRCPAPVTPMTCLWCGVEIYGRGDRLTCSSRCRQAYRRAGIKLLAVLRADYDLRHPSAAVVAVTVRPGASDRERPA